jgi:N-acetylneuraminate lyase
MEKIKGLVAAPFTPMTESGAVDYNKIELQATLFRKNNLAGVFVCGTTGEGISLTVEERKRVVEEWAKFTDGSLKLIVHVGNDCLEIAKDLASHAQKVGAFAVSAIGPVFFKPKKLELLAEWCQQVAAAAPSIPFYYYHIPGLTGLNFPMRDFLPLLEQRIPNLGGIKYSNEDHFDMSCCIRYENYKYDVFFGMDEIILSGFIAGARAAVGSFYNICPGIVNEIIELFKKNEIEKAANLQKRVQDLARIYFKFGGNIGVGKAILKAGGIDVGPARLPVPNLDDQQFEKLKLALSEIGFDEFVIRS